MSGGWQTIGRIRAVLAALVMSLTAPAAHAGETGQLFGNTIWGSPSASTEVEFTVILPPRDPAALDRFLATQQDSGSPYFHQWLQPGQFAANFGPDPAAVAKAAARLRAAGFAVTTTSSFALRASATVGSVNRLFGVHLLYMVTPNGAWTLAADRQLQLPPELTAVGAQIMAFDGFHRMRTYADARPRPLNQNSAVGPYSAADLRQAYDAPSYQSFNGQGRTIAVLMWGDVLDNDIVTYFLDEGLPVPSAARVQVNGGAPFSASSGASMEATLDIQQSAGMAPGARILLYVVPTGSDSDIYAGISRIIADNQADIVSMSFGACEKLYTAAYGANNTVTLTNLDNLFKQGNAQGITFIAASGDNGGLQCPPPGYFSTTAGLSWQPGANQPATMPEVTAVGGTNLVTTVIQGSTASLYLGEHAYDDPLTAQDPYGLGVTLSGGVWGSGGGPSVVFTAPSWQALVKTGTTMRATPDLALHMGGCPVSAVAPCGVSSYRSGNYLIFNGQIYDVVGTSVAAPSFAGALALVEQAIGGVRLGNINQVLYQIAARQTPATAQQPFHRTIGGYNGVYTSNADGSAPYNMVIGNGTFDILQAINNANIPAAGNPGSASNP